MKALLRLRAVDVEPGGERGVRLLVEAAQPLLLPGVERDHAEALELHELLADGADPVDAPLRVFPGGDPRVRGRTASAGGATAWRSPRRRS